MNALDLERPWICFDLETTGVDPERDRIVEIAVIKRTPDDVESRREVRLNPTVPIPPEASEVHHIHDRHVAKCKTFKQIASSLFSYLDGCDLIGYNLAAYDVPLLTAEFKRVGSAWPGPDVRIVDAMAIYKRQEGARLSAAFAFYTHETLENAHSAMADTEATLKIIQAQAARYEAKSITELIALMRDPDWVDQSGKLKWVGDDATMNFGKNSGTPLYRVQAGYLRWILQQDFPTDFKQICREALAGRLPLKGVTNG